MASDSPKPQTSAKADKAERLAEALRANLRRRKAQANARRDDPGSDTDTEPTSLADTEKT